MACRRFCLHLDSEILLERLLLERLESIPKTRRPEWLRGLLVRGFLAENRALRQVRDGHGDREGGDSQTNRRHSRPGSGFSDWLSRPGRPQREKRVAPIASQPTPGKPTEPTEPTSDAQTPADKPFAHLRKVIG